MSTEESEKRFEEELERLENEPSYMRASWEKFSIKGKATDIGAKYLWLKYTLLKEDVPDNVMERMIKIIKYDIQLYEDPTSTSPEGRTSYGALSKKEKEKPVFMLLDLAINKPEDFWKILQTPENNILLASQFDEDLLKETRIAFPRERKLKPGELYDFFGRQLGIKEDDSDDTDSIEEKMRNRYRKTYVKNKKAEELLFK